MTKHFSNFRRTIGIAVRAVPSIIEGGDSRHIYLLESRLHQSHAPGNINFTGATANAQTVRVNETCATTLDSYNTQESAHAILHKIIIANVPAKLLVVHEDADSGLDEIEPRTLLETIETRAAPVTCVDAKTLKATCDTPLTFDTKDPLTSQFVLAKKAIADLRRVHGITTSEAQFMME